MKWMVSYIGMKFSIVDVAWKLTTVLTRACSWDLIFEQDESIQLPEILLL